METPMLPYPTATRYPLTFRVDYPDKPLSRLSTFFRFLWIIPILVIATLLTSGSISIEGTDYSWSWASMGILSCPSCS